VSECLRIFPKLASGARLEHHEPEDDQQDQRVEASDPEQPVQATPNHTILGPARVGQVRETRPPSAPE
jgi:hypothetical protein